jgi:DNA replication and repair protein RecF
LAQLLAKKSRGLPYFYCVLYLNSLHITHFKNIASAKLAFSPRLNCFVGLNGMGKTNLLDAIHFLCLCKSHRGLPDRNLVQIGTEFFRLEGKFKQEQGQQKVVAKFSAGKIKEFERNGTAVGKLTDFIGQFPIVMIAPDDVELVQEGSEERRRFLDASLSQVYPEYLRQLLLYNNLLRRRNALLKNFAEERRFDPVLLEAYDRQIPEAAATIYTFRRAFVRDFQPLLQEYYAAISGGREAASVQYESDLEQAAMDTLLQDNLEKDRILQRTTAGPHRDDLALQLDGLSVKKYASQGQLKSFLLAMRLAQYDMLRREKHMAPLFLLDDIFDKLDSPRVRRLVALLIERQFGQIFITDTQPERIRDILEAFPGDHQLFEVSDGVVTRSSSAM